MSYYEDRCATPSEARAEYAANAGAEDRGHQWVLTPWDTWERNPHYHGPEQVHPESYCDDDFEPGEHPVEHLPADINDHDCPF